MHVTETASPVSQDKHECRTRNDGDRTVLRLRLVREAGKPSRSAHGKGPAMTQIQTDRRTIKKPSVKLVRALATIMLGKGPFRTVNMCRPRRETSGITSHDPSSYRSATNRASLGIQYSNVLPPRILDGAPKRFPQRPPTCVQIPLCKRGDGVGDELPG